MNQAPVKLTIFLLLLAVQGMAQFTLNGEIRPRAEFRNGYKQLAAKGADPAFLITQRTRLTGDYVAANTRFGIALQDVRTWGDLPQLNAANDKFTLHQAWMEYGIGSYFALKAGRQELVYDDARLLGNVDWVQQGRSHDAVLLKFRIGSTKVDAGGAYNQQGDPLFGNVYEVTGNYKTLQFLWAHQDFGKTGISLMAINHGMQFQDPSDSSFRTVFSQTIGPRLTTGIGKLQVAGAFYYQTGRNAKNRVSDAFYMALSAEHPLTGRWKAGAGFEYLSGTSERDKANPGYKDKSFNPLYGTGHKFNGHMDYFYVGNHAGSVGLQDIYIDLRYSSGNYSAYLTGHYFAAAAGILDKADNTKDLSSALGTELDFGFEVKLAPAMSAIAGYSQMFPTASLQSLRGGDQNATHNWVWLMLVYKPVLLKM